MQGHFEPDEGMHLSREKLPTYNWLQSAFLRFTHPKVNMSPEKGPFQKKMSSNHQLLGDIRSFSGDKNIHCSSVQSGYHDRPQVVQTDA